MVVIMALFALLPHVFNLPELIGKWLRRPKRLAALASSDPDEAAAHVLGDALRRGAVSPKATAEITAAFWAADGPDRRALAYLVAGLCDDGPVLDGKALAVVRNLRPKHAPTEEYPSPQADAARPNADLPQDGIRPLREKV
jgi:hypothetical protein